MSKRAKPPEPAHPHVEKALAYARGVLDGSIIACKWVRLACQRHINDLDAAAGDAFAYTFDPAKAERAAQFVELMPHTKGKWARDREKLRLEPWQCFFVCVLYGWTWKSTGLRRFKFALLLVPRKNGKSPLAAALGLYGFAADHEFGAEVYSGATSEKQAWEVFRPARLMARDTPEFLEQFGVQVGAKNLYILADGSRFEPVIGKPGDGAAPSVAIVDEYHEHDSPELFDTMETGMVGREQPLMLVITTAGASVGGPCYELVERARKMLDGTVPDDQLFAVEYTIDEGDDWTTEDALRKANPNLGVSVVSQTLRKQQLDAVQSTRYQNTFKTKHLNVWVTARDAWMNMEWWRACADPALRAEDFAGEACAFGSDLASRVDLASVARVFRRDLEDGPHFYAFARHYAPRAAVDDPANWRYAAWEHEGRLTATEGNDIDYDRIAADVMADAAAHGFGGMMVDPWNHRAMTDQLKREGVAEELIVEVPQTTMHLSPAMKDFEAVVKAGRFHHDGDPLLAWAMSNVTVKPDAKDNIFPRKDRPENKIDPAIAVILTFKQAQTMSAEPFVGFYAE